MIAIRFLEGDTWLTDWIDGRKIGISDPGHFAIDARCYLRIGEQDRVMMKAILD
jgi:hypothetical protein